MLAWMNEVPIFVALITAITFAVRILGITNFRAWRLKLTVAENIQICHCEIDSSITKPTACDVSISNDGPVMGVAKVWHHAL